MKMKGRVTAAVSIGVLESLRSGSADQAARPLGVVELERESRCSTCVSVFQTSFQGGGVWPRC